MLPTHFVLCLLCCIAFSGAVNAVYEDCQTPPPVDHARAELFKSDAINTANYSCAIGYVLKGANELICNLETEEWQGDPPTCVKAKGNVHNERKKKLLAIPEELNVAIELAQKLDLSCIQANVQAPEISHGIVSKYERRRRGEKIFLVAYYACNHNYNFESPKVNALYCSTNQWVGELPSCEANDEEEDEEDNYDEYETIDNDYNTNDELDNDNESEIAEHANADPVAPPPPPPPVEKQDSVEEIDEDEPATNPEPKAEIEPVFEVQVKPATPPVQLEAEPEVIQPEPEVSQSEPVAEPEVEPGVEPAVELQAEPVAEPKTQPEPAVVVQVNEQQPEPELQTEQAPVTDINIVVAPTKDPYTPRQLDENCGKDNGQCEHKCQRLLFPGENEPRLMCSCNEGYTLDPQDYASCHDIDECQESNGGCSQICNNLAGSFECACEKGYQIDANTGKSCVDIDECAQSEVAAECANGCENTPGSYRCVIALNTKEEAVEEAQSAEQHNQIAPEPEVTTTTVEPSVAQPSCNPGFVLSADANECQDINECEVVVEDNGNADHVPHRVCQQKCENTIGSYRCGCHEGYHLLEDQSSCAFDSCEDLDNPQLNRTRCAHQCENLANGRYACLCPEGYTLDEQDLHSCKVVETVCSREQGYERCQPGSCVASEDNSTFSCLCPPGYISEIFSCQDLDECVMGTHKCSHDCLNTDGGYQCVCPRGMTLQEPEAHTCVAPDPCAMNNNGCEQLCLSADAGACTCSKGYTLHEDGKSCTDVDECQVKNGGCQQLCRNLPGAYECVCAPGYELLHLDGISGYCFDIDECASNTHSCLPPMRCENLNGSYTCLCEPGYALGLQTSATSLSYSATLSSSSLLALPFGCLDIDECSLSNANCSHYCINLAGSFQCACPIGFSLDAAARNCLDNDECLLNNGQCAQLCLNQPGGFACACNAGYQLAPDGFACLDIDECAEDFGNCSSICINLLGSHACACDRGYELASDGHSCQDVDECAGLLAGGCTHECINKPGSYECGCPLDYLLQEDERSCLPASLDCPPGTEHTQQGCEPIDCGPGKLLGADNSCVDIDECQVNNGGCSHLCANAEGSYSCSCSAGYTLGANKHNCEDVDECAVDNGGCQDSCSNEPGSFKCGCAPGKRLSFDMRSCFDEPRIEPRVQLAAPPAAPVPVAPPTAPVRPIMPAAPVRPVRPAAPVRPVRPVLPVRPIMRAPVWPVSPAQPAAPVWPVSPGQPALPVLPELSVPQVRDQCVRFQAPTNGQAHCNKYRHKRKLFYNTRCKVRCNDGFMLLGSEIRSCGASGNWEGLDNKCVPIAQPRLWMSATARPASASAACPALPAPRNGVISPASCTQANSNFGAYCQLQCNMGFVPVAGFLTSCMNGWSLGSVLDCKPFGADMFGNQMSPRVQAPWQKQPFRQLSIQQQLQTQPFPIQSPAQQHIKPYITCPESVVILLNPRESRAHVILQRPATNVDYRHVVAFPAWAAKLQAHLPAGVYKIVYRAHDPNTNQNVGCQTIITIKQQQAAAPNPYAFSPASNAVFRPASSPAFRPASRQVFSSALRPAPVPDFRAAPVFGTAPASMQFESLFDASRRSENLIDETPRAKPAKNLFDETPSPSRNAESSRIDLGTSTSGYCPPSFEVTLKENQNLRSVLWKEPRFEGKLLKIYKSSFPGALFGLGDHTVKYEATTTDGLTVQCIFQIQVKRNTATESASNQAEITYPDLPSSSAPAALTQQTHSSLFAGHESYVICPGEEPVKVTDRQSVNLPVGCTLKNVRPQTSSQTHPKRGLLTSLWRQYANI